MNKYRLQTLVLVGAFVILWGVRLTPYAAFQQEQTAFNLLDRSMPEMSSDREYSSQRGQSYTAHDPINITSDEDFIAYGFNGTGTKDDPYRIEGLNITTTKLSAINITNTTMHFVVSDCYLHTQTEKGSVSHGIYLYNITEGSVNIINNIITGNGRGIFMKFLPAISIPSVIINIINNTIDNNGIGISCTSFEYLFIADNVITQSYTGILIGTSITSIISNNTITDTEDGIILSRGESATIIHNYIHVKEEGITLGRCVFVAITNNVVIDGFINWSSYIQGGKGIFITNNTIIGTNKWGGIIALGENTEGQVLVTYNNILSNTNYGLVLDTTANTTIYGNNFIGNGGENSQGREYVFKGVDQNNTWYNETAQQGNYWSDYDGKGAYAIDGNVGSKDLYPLNTVIDPILSRMDYSPDLPFPGDEITIDIAIKEALTVDQVVLMYRVIGEQDAWQHVPMTGDGTAYAVTLGSFTEPSIILYYVRVEDTTGSIFDSSVFGFVIRPKGLFPFSIPFASFVLILLYLGVAALPYTCNKIRKGFSSAFS